VQNSRSLGKKRFEVVKRKGKGSPTDDNLGGMSTEEGGDITRTILLEEGGGKRKRTEGIRYRGVRGERPIKLLKSKTIGKRKKQRVIRPLNRSVRPGISRRKK